MKMFNISLKFVPKGPINNIPALVPIMAWRRPGDKILSEPMMVSLPTHICVTRPQWIDVICVAESTNFWKQKQLEKLFWCMSLGLRHMSIASLIIGNSIILQQLVQANIQTPHYWPFPHTTGQ